MRSLNMILRQIDDNVERERSLWIYNPEGVYSFFIKFIDSNGNESAYKSVKQLSDRELEKDVLYYNADYQKGLIIARLR